MSPPIDDSVERERLIRALGGQIFDRMKDASGPSILSRDYWTGRMMEWAMRDPSFKTEIFRFVDVFPALDGPDEIASHVQQYFCRPEQDFPAWIQMGLGQVAPGSLVARAAAHQIEKNMRATARMFVAGESINEAKRYLRTARKKRRLAFTFDLLGEATVSEAEADVYLDRYLALLDEAVQETATYDDDALPDAGEYGTLPRAQISVKVTSLSSKIIHADSEGSVARVMRRLRPLALRVKNHGAGMTLDMETYATKDLTLEVFRTLMRDPEFANYPHFGCVLQAYLRDTDRDCAELLAWARTQGVRFHIRLVKGAYWDMEVVHAQEHGWPIPVYTTKSDTDAAYERCARMLVQEPCIMPAFASHNVRSIAASLIDARAANRDPRALEVQTLYGMAQEMKGALVELGVRVREYIPIGEAIPGMAYLVRRLLENTSNEGFITRHESQKLNRDELLMPPATVEGATPLCSPRADFENTPLLDFTRSDVRTRAQQSLAEVRRALPFVVYPQICGEPRDGATSWNVFNPARTSELVATTHGTRTEDLELALQASFSAFGAWSRRPVSERAACLRRLADLLERDRYFLAALLTIEVGKNRVEADAEVAEAIDFCRFYADGAERLQGVDRRLGHYPGERNTMSYRGLGPGVVIAPWNFPLAILCGMTVASLVTGNAALMKPAESASAIASELFRRMQEAGFPSDVVHLLPAVGSELGPHLTRDARVRWMAFTGSWGVGMHLQRAGILEADGYFGPKRVIAEMGGKNAIIVDSDADLDEAVAIVLHSAFGYQGQKCSACSRVIVVGSAATRFEQRLADALLSLPIGDPSDPSATYGPMIDGDALERVQDAVATAERDGRIVACIDPQRADGHYAPFCVVADLPWDHPLCQQEIFGPLLVMLRAETFEEAVQVANATPFALTGGVVSRSPHNLAYAREHFDVGNLYINRPCTGALVYRHPFGGFRNSGVGFKAGGPDYLLQFVQARAVAENMVRRGFAPEEDTSSAGRA